MDSVKISIHKTDGTQLNLSIDRERLLSSLQKIVGGPVEVVRTHSLKEGKILLANENGRLLGLPPNLSDLTDDPRGPPLVGDLILMDEKDFD